MSFHPVISSDTLMSVNYKMMKLVPMKTVFNKIRGLTTITRQLFLERLVCVNFFYLFFHAVSI